MPAGERPSLLDCFAPPAEDLRGTFALVCGYSAEAGVIDTALDRFVGVGAEARRHHGRLIATLLLDGQHPPVVDVAGSFHAAMRPRSQRPTAWHRMHAKVALLGFGPAVRGPATHLRLVVGTGNWTLLTLRRSIDFFWSIELGKSTERQVSSANSADIAEAIAFFTELIRGYLLPDPVVAAVEEFLSDARSMARGRTSAPRFIHTLTGAGRGLASGAEKTWSPASIGRQVLARFADFRAGSLLAVGSGFFEQAGDVGAEPVVIAELDAALRQRHIVRSQHCERWLACNPGTAGAVAAWAQAADALSWDLCRPKHPDPVGEAQLHAKYVGVFRRDLRGHIRRGRLYLGSGNLSRRGFLWAPRRGDAPAGMGLGNVEAGVVLEVGQLSCDDFVAALGIDPVDDLRADELKDHVDDEDDTAAVDERPVPPVLALVVVAGVPSRVRCCWAETPRIACELRWAGYTVQISPDQEEVDLPQIPPQVNIAVGDLVWTIPVFAGPGELVRPPPVQREFDEILGRLLAFPSVDEDDDEVTAGDDYDGADGADGAPTTAGATTAVPARSAFALHRTALLVERIAQRNQQLARGALPDWIDWLERSLIEELPAETRAAFAECARYVLAPLRHEPGFAPPGGDTTWVAFIDRLEKAWIGELSVGQAEGASA